MLALQWGVWKLSFIFSNQDSSKSPFLLKNTGDNERLIPEENQNSHTLYHSETCQDGENLPLEKNVQTAFFPLKFYDQ